MKDSSSISFLKFLAGFFGLLALGFIGMAAISYYEIQEESMQASTAAPEVSASNPAPIE